MLQEIKDWYLRFLREASDYPCDMYAISQSNQCCPVSQSNQCCPVSQSNQCCPVSQSSQVGQNCVDCIYNFRASNLEFVILGHPEDVSILLVISHMLMTGSYDIVENRYYASSESSDNKNSTKYDNFILFIDRQIVEESIIVANDLPTLYIKVKNIQTEITVAERLYLKTIGVLTAQDLYDIMLQIPTD